MSDNIPRSPTELRNRISIAKGIVNYLETEATDDPRAPDAIAHYQGQLKKLEGELREAEVYYADKPAPTVVHLKTAVLDFRQKGETS